MILAGLECSLFRLLPGFFGSLPLGFCLLGGLLGLCQEVYHLSLDLYDLIVGLCHLLGILRSQGGRGGSFHIGGFRSFLGRLSSPLGLFGRLLGIFSGFLGGFRLLSGLLGGFLVLCGGLSSLFRLLLGFFRLLLGLFGGLGGGFGSSLGGLCSNGTVGHIVNGNAVNHILHIHRGGSALAGICVGSGSHCHNLRRLVHA